LFTLLAAAALTAQSPPAQPPPQPPPAGQPAASKPDPQKPQVFKVEANFVRVDVLATRDGAPVTDLTREDFQVFEDGKPQTVSAFEHVSVITGRPQELRSEPNNIRESRDAMKNPRARVFILFLDVPHVTMAGAWTLREPLIRMVDRLMGAEDLIGIMTPRMAASDVVFARKTTVLEGVLRDRWPWGERFTLARDEVEKLYEMCYPWESTREVVRQMIARKRERQTLEALHELVDWLRDQREERKAVLTFTEGWVLYRRDASLTSLRVISPTGDKEPVPGPDPIHVGPDGRLRTGARDSTGNYSKTQCDADRMRLSEMDNDYFFRDLIDEANRANATFYTVDPRGLAAFDSPIGPDPPPPPHVDQAILRGRQDSMRVLSQNTDGFAVLNSNNLDRGLRRISDDLSSYYLLGYYSTNTKLDGKFRSLKVNVRKPGIDIRARRGYKAASEAEVKAARAASNAPIPETVSSAREAVDGLSRLRAGAPLATHAVALGSTVWVTGELPKPATAPATAAVNVVQGSMSASAEATIAAGQRAFVAAVPLKAGGSGSLDIRLRVTLSDGAATSDGVRIEPASGFSAPLMFRRGPATGNQLQPAGQPQFSRTERARFEAALDGSSKVDAVRILDRNGTAVELPVTVSERSDTAGQRWSTADITLAALAPGDYLVEFSGSAEGKSLKRLAAFRVTR
jgi:VWFA-related protein